AQDGAAVRFAQRCLAVIASARRAWCGPVVSDFRNIRVSYADSPSRHLGPATIGLVVFVIGGVLAMAVDVPRTGYGLKSDEANYVAAALSAAYDGDLAFDHNDLVRFEGLYHQGPDGIFLKRGKVVRF